MQSPATRYSRVCQSLKRIFPRLFPANSFLNFFKSAFSSSDFKCTCVLSSSTYSSYRHFFMHAIYSLWQISILDSVSGLAQWWSLWQLKYFSIQYDLHTTLSSAVLIGLKTPASTISGTHRIYNNEILVRTYVLYFMPGHKCMHQRAPHQLYNTLRVLHHMWTTNVTINGECCNTCEPLTLQYTESARTHVNHQLYNTLRVLQQMWTTNVTINGECYNTCEPLKLQYTESARTHVNHQLYNTRRVLQHMWTTNVTINGECYNTCEPLTLQYTESARTHVNHQLYNTRRVLQHMWTTNVTINGECYNTCEPLTLQYTESARTHVNHQLYNTRRVLEHMWTTNFTIHGECCNTCEPLTLQ